MNWNHLARTLVLTAALIISPLSFAEPVWIDVRSQAEYDEDHIEGDVFIPHEEIVGRVSEMFPDKTTEIHLYCRSGGRAGRAMNALEDAGYTNVSNAGGIEDAREARALDD